MYYYNGKFFKDNQLTFAKAVVSKSGSSSFGRAVAFQASGGRFEPGLPLFLSLQLSSYTMEAANWATSRCSSVVEHFLGKEEVKGSIPFNGSTDIKKKYVICERLLSSDKKVEECDATGVE